MSMTPRTDAKCGRADEFHYDVIVVPVGVSRLLETELAAVTAERDALTIPDNSVAAGEEDVERIWSQSKGIDREGRMWLTPRMWRNARKTQKQWEAESL